MQLKLPIFPPDCKMISSTVGVYEQEGLIQYIVNGLPVYSHDREDLQALRYFTSNLIHQGLCKQAEVARCFKISDDSVMRYAKRFREEREQAFFSSDNRQGHCHKLRGAALKQIQRKLDSGQSQNSIAKEHEVSEGSIRYAIKQGYLKKKVRKQLNIHP